MAGLRTSMIRKIVVLRSTEVGIAASQASRNETFSKCGRRRSVIRCGRT